MNYDYKGIKITATTKMQEVKYLDNSGEKRTRLEKDVIIFVHFWDFTIWNGDLYELTFVKSCLQFFLQSFWRRSSNDGIRFELSETLRHEDPRDGDESLHFAARQKHGKISLYIFVQRGDETINEVYLNSREVIMLDLVIGKAIHMLTPNILHNEPIFDSKSIAASERSTELDMQSI
jgi:hypothetical protein